MRCNGVALTHCCSNVILRHSGHCSVMAPRHLQRYWRRRPVNHKWFPTGMGLLELRSLIRLPLDKMAVISQTTSSDAFSWMKRFEFWLKFNCSLFLGVQLTITHYMNHWRIYAALEGDKKCYCKEIHKIISIMFILQVPPQLICGDTYPT